MKNSTLYHLQIQQPLVKRKIERKRPWCEPSNIGKISKTCQIRSLQVHCRQVATGKQIPVDRNTRKYMQSQFSSTNKKLFSSSKRNPCPQSTHDATPAPFISYRFPVPFCRVWSICRFYRYWCIGEHVSPVTVEGALYSIPVSVSLPAIEWDT